MPDVDDRMTSQSPLFAKQAGPLALTAGILFIVAQVIWWTFEQRQNAATARDPLHQSASVLYLVGFCVLLFALIGAHGWQVRESGRFGMFALIVAILGTMLLGGDLWFETFAVPWLAEGPSPEILKSDPSILLGLGAISSYLTFAAGWTLFGIASLRARVFPVAISILIVIGGIAGFSALLAPFGIPLGIAIASLGGWMVQTGPR